MSETLALRPSDVDEGAGTLGVGAGKARTARVAVVDGEALGHVRPWLEVDRRQGINGRAPIVNTVADGAKRAGVCTSGQPLDSS